MRVADDIQEANSRNSRVYGPDGSLVRGSARAQQELQDYLDSQERDRFFRDLTSAQPVMVIIDGESVATATTRAESEGA